MLPGELISAASPVVKDRHWYLGLLITWTTVVLPFALLFGLLAGVDVYYATTVSLLLAPLVHWVYLRVSENFPGDFQWWSLQLFGVGCLIFVTLPAVHLLVWLYPTIGQWVSAPVLALCVLLLILPWAIYRANVVKLTPLSIVHPGVKSPRKIIQLSDVHIGSRSGKLMDKLVREVERQNPELVVITGDLVDMDWVSSDTLQALSRIQCPVYMSLGNHEFDINLERCIQNIEQHGVVILRDRSVVIDELQIIGLDDRERGEDLHPVLSRIDRLADKFQLLLYHRPNGWLAAKSCGIDLMLAGHTHGGQIWPFYHLVKRHYPEIAGHYTENDKHLFVSRGCGTWGPVMRLGSYCEMTVIQLQRPLKSMVPVPSVASRAAAETSYSAN